jgi:hypothetical protein
LIDMWSTKYPYLVTTIGVALMAISAVVGLARGMPSPSGSPADRHFANMTATNMTAVANLNPNAMSVPFGLMDNLALVAIATAIVGLVWLGLIIRKLEKATKVQVSKDGPPHDLMRS